MALQGIMQNIAEQLEGWAQDQEEIGETEERKIPSAGGWLQFGGILSATSMPMGVATAGGNAPFGPTVVSAPVIQPIPLHQGSATLQPLVQPTLSAPVVTQEL